MKKRNLSKKIKMQILAWAVVVSMVSLIGGSFAWYTIQNREADSKTVEVMEPYFLKLQNPGDTAELQLAVGSLFPGKTKQVVFCVSNKENEEGGNVIMGGGDFDYTMEVIYTENLALNYKIYELEKVSESEKDNPETIWAEYSETGGTKKVNYWKKKTGTALTGDDSITSERQAQAGLTENVSEIMNKGKYISYDKNTNGEKLHLQSKTDGYNPQFFVMEITWNTAVTEQPGFSFSDYEKETDMIYILVKALQLKPEKGTT
ncbi:MAG: hypothetical protein ACI4E5_08975 [Suilimivivens sp.]